MEFYLIRHSKEDNIKFTGHLDLIKAIHRIISRADIGICYSQGYNPHMILTSAQPTPVGMMSDAEYLMMQLETEKSEDEILQSLNNSTTNGIAFTFIKKLEDGSRNPMGTLTHIGYLIEIPGDEKLKNEIEGLFRRDEWITETVSKKGVKRTMDLRPRIKKYGLSVKDNGLVLRILASAGSREHLSMDNFLKYVEDNTENYPKDRFIRIKREEMYLGDYPNLKSLEEI